MQSKTFSRLSTVLFIILSLIVLVWIGNRAFQSAPLPPEVLKPVQTAPTPSKSLPITDIRTPTGIIHALTASSSIDREQGLSGRSPLPKDTGMLFVFPNAGAYGFWMKDMNFPIDMVWIGADKRVSGVLPGALPSSYPTIFYPPAPAVYVLELDSGAASDHGIATGTKLVF